MRFSKKWAKEQGYYIVQNSFTPPSYEFMLIKDEEYNIKIECGVKTKTEEEAVDKLCQWILDNKESK